jgi:hypothetical protein
VLRATYPHRLSRALRNTVSQISEQVQGIHTTIVWVIISMSLINMRHNMYSYLTNWLLRYVEYISVEKKFWGILKRLNLELSTALLS